MAEETPSNLHWSYKTPLHPCHSRWHCQLLLLQEMAGLLPYTICYCLLIHLFICSVKSDNHEHTKLPYFQFLTILVESVIDYAIHFGTYIF